MDSFPKMDVLVVYGFYLSLLALLYGFLSYNVFSTRRELGILPDSNGEDSGTKAILRRAMLALDEFQRYVPLCLILLLLVSQITSTVQWNVKPMSIVTHVLFVLLFLGRLCHMYGVLYAETSSKPYYGWRHAGYALTLIVMMLASLILLVNWAYLVLYGG